MLPFNQSFVFTWHDKASCQVLMTMNMMNRRRSIAVLHSKKRIGEFRYADVGAISCACLWVHSYMVLHLGHETT